MKSLKLVSEELDKRARMGVYQPHAAAYSHGELAKAGFCYADCASGGRVTREILQELARVGRAHREWPFADSAWKPSRDDSVTSRVYELVQASAFLIAEVERLLVAGNI